MIYGITFWVATPIVADAPIHLDGLLSAVHPAMHGLPLVTSVDVMPEVRYAPLPIDSAKVGDIWVWCATAGVYGPVRATSIDGRVKACGGIDYYYLSRTQHPRMGATRDRLDELTCNVCEYVQFLASSNDVAQLRRICGRVQAIGGQRKAGYGRVTRFEVMPAPEGISWVDCLVKDGVAMRNIPAAMVEDGDLHRINTAPPYWLPPRDNMGVRFGDRCTLSEAVWLNEQRVHEQR